jgi:aminoglycoside phosphotransferase (APT) family kinase protein
MVHLPPGKSDQYLVPEEATFLVHMVTSLLSLSPARRRALGAAARLPGMAGVLAGLSPEAGIIVRRTGARPLLQWLAVEGPPLTRALIRTKWRAQGGTAVLHCFTDTGKTPLAVGKAALSEGLTNRTEREAEALEALRPVATRAGIRIPEGRLIRSAAGWPLLLQRHLSGRSAASLLRAGLADPLEILGRLTTWLAAWNRSSAAVEVLDQRRLENELLAPLARLAPLLLHSGSQYLERVHRLAADALGSPMPLVAVHNDLTMQNVLLEPASPLGVIDWEAARKDGLPLADFYYAAVDVFAQEVGGLDRMRAFLTCFGPTAARAKSVFPLGEEIRQAAQLSSVLVPICFHACWIRHAANEAEKHPHAAVRPFLEIVRWLADQPGDNHLPGAW